MTPKEVADVMPGAKYGSVKKLMWTMLGDGQLLKNEKGRYSPANPTASGNPGATGNPTGNPGNSRNQHTYGEKEHWVTGVTGVTGVGEYLHGTPDEKLENPSLPSQPSPGEEEEF